MSCTVEHNRNYSFANSHLESTRKIPRSDHATYICDGRSVAQYAGVYIYTPTGSQSLTLIVCHKYVTSSCGLHPNHHMCDVSLLWNPECHKSVMSVCIQYPNYESGAYKMYEHICIISIVPNKSEAFQKKVHMNNQKL